MTFHSSSQHSNLGLGDEVSFLFSSLRQIFMYHYIGKFSNTQVVFFFEHGFHGSGCVYKNSLSFLDFRLHISDFRADFSSF